MRKWALLLALSSGTLAFAGVSVSSPANNSNVSTTVQFVANATSSCPVSAMGIYTAPGVLAYTVNGSRLNTLINLAPGTYNTTVQAWTACGTVQKTSVQIHVGAPSAQVQVIAPRDNSNVAQQVQFVAGAVSGCAKGVAAMGIYTAPGELAYQSPGASINKVLNLNPGTYHTVVQEWDHCGGTAKTPVTINVGGVSQGGSVQVKAPANNSTVSSNVQYTATATTSCAKGVAAIGVYRAPGALAYVTGGAQLNTVLNFSPGTYHTVIQEWDHCGGSSVAPVAITVGAADVGGGGTFKNLHQQPSWKGYGLLAPGYAICDSCQPSGPQVTWSMAQGISSPSMTGNSTRMDIGGQTRYSDVLWNNHLIGDFSSQGLSDTNKTLVPKLHNFTYDVYFYVHEVNSSQALEFDINQFVNGKSFIWGHECRIAGGNQWDVWDNPSETWIPTGIPCNPIPDAWNHLVLQVERTSDDHLLFKSITLNGKTAVLNRYDSPTPTNWYGVTINYQQDGNYAQSPYSVWLDNLNFSYW